MDHGGSRTPFQPKYTKHHRRERRDDGVADGGGRIRHGLGLIVEGGRKMQGRRAGRVQREGDLWNRKFTNLGTRTRDQTPGRRRDALRLRGGRPPGLCN